MFLIYDPQNSFRFFVVDRFPRWPPLQDKVLTFVQVKSTAYFLLLFCTPVYRPRFLCRPTAFFFDLLEPWNVRELYIRKTADLPLQLCVDTFHVSWLSDFIIYQKPLYKSLHQWFFYSFIIILPSESGVTLHYSTILTLGLSCL